MKKRIRIFSVLLVTSLLLWSVAFSVSSINFTDIGTELTMMEEKVYANATIDQDFADDSVLVVLDKSVGGINRTVDTSLFSSVDIKSVKDLSAMSNYVGDARSELTVEGDELYSSAVSTAESNTSRIAINSKATSLVNEANFRQILCLDLTERSKANVLEVIAELEKVPGILYAGPNYIMELDSTIPNDAYYDDLWGLEKINAPGTWDITTGSSDVYVAVIDSGVASHPDLNANVAPGWDYVNSNSTTTDDIVGHGTHVAGIIGAVGNNDMGISGLAWNVKIVPYQVTYNVAGNFRTSEAITAIKDATDYNIPIINYSLSGANHFDVRQAISNYRGLFICSAGNSTSNNDSTNNIKLDNVISVANTTVNDTLYIDSNYGASSVHLGAPGTGIYSCYLNSSYRSLNGTSMAAPHVTGVAALIKSVRPDLSATEIKALILNNVDKVSGLSGKCITGGRLNAYKAVRAATEPKTIVGEFNDDGREDVLLVRKVNGMFAFTVYLGKADGGFQEPITTQSVHQYWATDLVYSGDFNGDGLTDIVVHWSYNNKRQLLTYISKGDGTFYEGANLDSVRLHNQNSYPCTLHVGDVNGDGKDDFIVRYRSDGGSNCMLVYKGVATSPYFLDAPSNALTSGNSYLRSELVFIGDFNGDGCDDMMMPKTYENIWGQLMVYKANEETRYNAGVSFTGSHLVVLQEQYFIADVNGDGKDDFIVHWNNGLGNRCNTVYLGESNSLLFRDADVDALVSSDKYNVSDPVMIGDINGDGRDDM